MSGFSVRLSPDSLWAPGPCPACALSWPDAVCRRREGGVRLTSPHPHTVVTVSLSTEATVPVVWTTALSQVVGRPEELP
ncbi:hypothetical protein AAY473_014089 [Plecturocebus cupreus]